MEFLERQTKGKRTLFAGTNSENRCECIFSSPESSILNIGKEEVQYQITVPRFVPVPSNILQTLET